MARTNCSRFGFVFHTIDNNTKEYFFLENATGSQALLNKIREAYRAYGKYTTAWAYANLHLRHNEGFPSLSKIHADYKNTLNRYPELAEGLEFVDRELAALDQISEGKGISIDLEMETRKDPKERSQIISTATSMETTMDTDIRSAEEFRQFVLRMWNMIKIRDQKIADDVAALYRKALRKNEQTRIYISLGYLHYRASDFLSSKLNKRPSYEISMIKIPDDNEEAAFFGKVFSSIDSSKPIPPEQWQATFTEWARIIG